MVTSRTRSTGAKSAGSRTATKSRSGETKVGKIARKAGELLKKPLVREALAGAIVTAVATRSARKAAREEVREGAPANVGAAFGSAVGTVAGEALSPSFEKGRDEHARDKIQLEQPKRKPLARAKGRRGVRYESENRQRKKDEVRCPQVFCEGPKNAKRVEERRDLNVEPGRHRRH